MSCNGCRVLRKGCSETCVLRTCLQWIDTSEAQGHATVFVAKFFGRAGLMSFINAAPHTQRPALFQSLLFEACGRTINPVTGAVGLLWAGNWHLCQAAAETVLRGGTLQPLPEISSALDLTAAARITEAAEETAARLYVPPESGLASLPASMRRKACSSSPNVSDAAACDLDLCLTPHSPDDGEALEAKRCRQGSPSINSEGSVTSNGESGGPRSEPEPRLLSLFV